MKNPIKHILCAILAVAMMLSVCLPVLADGESITVASKTVTLKSDSIGESEIVSYTAETDGILTVNMAAANPGWAFRVSFSNGEGTLLISGTEATAYEYEMTAGTSCDVELYAYEKAMWSIGDGEIAYTITFTPAELNQEVVTEEYVLSDVSLVLGANTVTMAPNAQNTVFAFTPDETGTYKFTTDNADALLGKWGYNRILLTNPGENVGATLEHTITAVGQSIMVGLSGVEGCTITVEKTADYQETVIETVVYENKHVFGSYAYDEEALVEIDIFDSVADVAVLCEDGFYHYGSAYGPVMVIDLKTIAVDVNSAYTYRQLTCYTTENGVTVKHDYNDAMMAYYNQGLYPVTEELAMMLREVGNARGWYMPGGFVYTDATEVNEEIAWMGMCYYVSGTETIAPPTITLKYPTLAFEDEILYNLYFTVDDTSSIVEMGLVTFADRNYEGTVNEALEIIPGYVANSDGSFTVQSNGVPAKLLGDAMFFKVYVKLTDGSYVYSSVVGYHAVAYANTILNSAASSAKAKALVVAMLNYGAAAQVSFEYKTDALMNAGLTEAQQALIESYSNDMVTDVAKPSETKSGSFVINGGYTDIHPTVSFEGAFSINYYFTPKYTPDNGTVTFYYWDAATYAKVGVLTTGNATGSVKMAVNGSCTAAIEGIAAKQIDDAVYVAAVYTSNGTSYPTSVIGYSLGAYCKNLAGKGNDFGMATAVYGFYAKAYFAN